MNRMRLVVYARRAAVWSGAALAVLALFILTTNLWVIRYSASHVGDAAVRDAATPWSEPTVAIVPGAFVRGLVPSLVLEHRLQCAKDLYNSGAVQSILVSGDHGSAHYDEVAAMSSWLVSHGVPTHDIVRDHAGFRTLDTMERAKRVFSVERALVCTQRFHLDRAVFLARRAGIEARGVVADRARYDGHRWNHLRETLARSAAFVDSYIIGREPRYL